MEPTKVAGLIQEVCLDTTKLFNRSNLWPEVNRSNGLHLSHIMTYAEERGRGNNWEQYSALSHEHQTAVDLLFAEGFLWEELLSYTLGRHMAVRPPEITLDGIAMSPDGVYTAQQVRELYDIVVSGDVLQESKCTTASAKNPPSAKWKWMLQVKCYMHALGLTRVIFNVLYLMGDYKKHTFGEVEMYPVPQALAYMYEFEPGELANTWAYVLSVKDEMQQKGVIDAILNS